MALIKFLLVLLSVFPLNVLRTLGGFFGRVVYHLDSKYRNRLDANAQFAGFIQSDFGALSAAHMGQGVLELAHIWTGKVDGLLSRVKVTGWDDVLKAQANGRGVLMLTPHVGAFELLSLWIGQRMPFTAMYRPPKVAALGAAMIKGRQKFNVNMASADVKGIRAMLRALKKGELVGLLPDQVPGGHADGVVIPVFGQPALSMTLPAKLIRQTNAALVTMSAIRVDAPHQFEIAFNVVDFVPCDDAFLDAAHVNQLMEAVIRQNPEQYLWAYNRYKNIPKTDSKTKIEIETNS